MAKRRFIAQDRWCEICSQPAALLVGTVAKDDNKLRPVCSYAHGEMLITQLGRADDAEKTGPLTLEDVDMGLTDEESESFKNALEHDDLTNA